MTLLEIRLASAIVHLLEHIDTGNALDYDAALGVLYSTDVERAFDDLALLPLRRDGKDPLCREVSGK